MKEKAKPITSHALVHALEHIHSLMLAEEQVFDDTGRLKELLRKLEITFSEEEDHGVVETLRRELGTLKTLVYKDELTGILNRRGILEEFNGFFREALFSKESDELRHGIIIKDFSILFFDVDDFKKINDTYGHEEGDRVLKEFARTLKKSARDIDAVGRFGGEEFVMGLLGATEEEGYTKAVQMLKSLKENVVVGDQPVTASVGVASLHQSAAQTLGGLIVAADEAMYAAKTHGKNRVVRYSERTKI